MFKRLSLKVSAMLLSAILLVPNCNIVPVFGTITNQGSQQNTNQNSNQNTTSQSAKDLFELRHDARKEIDDYAEVMSAKVDEQTAKKIKEIRNKYKNIIGLWDTKDKSSDEIKEMKKNGLATDTGISDCVSEARAAIDALVPSNEDATGQDTLSPSSTSDFIMVGGNWSTPVATYGQNIDIVLPIVNMSMTEVGYVTVTPVTSNAVAEWPFVIETSGYTQTIAGLPSVATGLSDMDRRRELTWTLRTRDDALSGYYKLQFNVLYYVGTDVENATLSTYVLVKGAAGSGSVEGGESAGTSTPRVLVTGFDTRPEKVKAGEVFTLILHLKNTSQRTAVSNMLVNFNAPSEGSDSDSTYAVFLPTSGSTSEYISSIAKGGTYDLSVEMNAKADMAQKPYQLDLQMEFEDENYNSYSSTADVLIPVYQDAKLELNTPEILPPSINVGGEANVMFSIFNTGKTTLYNVKVRFEGEAISGGESFLGKIESGGSGNVDAMVSGVASSETGNAKIVITYEDEAGNESSYEQEFSLPVSDGGQANSSPSEMTMDDEMYYGDDFYEEDSNSHIGIIVGVIVAVIVVAVVAVVVILRKKKAKTLEEDLEEFLFEGEDNSDENS